ncbi:MAG: hypothetical protein H6757_05070 [Candidatus Omnitrophica bacterium]|nr:hypothetical protein [Candidatus Omnitrophota bacterium]
MITIFSFFLFEKTLFAVYSEDAEKLDLFKEEALMEFQENLIAEEKTQEQRQLDSTVALDALDSLNAKSETVPQSGQETITKEEIELLKRKLLGVQKKDLFEFGVDGDYSYTTNVNGAVPRKEKGDSQWNSTANTQINLSGKKTDIRFELRGTKNWNLKQSINDSWQVEERLRSRRRFFKKTNVSMNSRIARNNSKTLEIDNNRIRYDLSNQATINYAFTPKISLNADLSGQKTVFLQEAFDQDSTWQVSMAPSGFWNLTPKSRISFGYTFGASRGRVESGDTNTHNIRIGYFGQVTKKSSASLDFSVNKSLPQSTDGSTSTSINTGLGYTWQMTPKVQMTFQYTRGLTNTTSESQGDPTDDATVTRTDTYAVNDNFSISFNHRLAQKISLSLTGGASHTRTVTLIDANKDSETRQFTFPFTFGATYVLTRWMRFNFRYNFSFRTGDEKSDTSRVHTYSSSMSMSF